MSKINSPAAGRAAQAAENARREAISIRPDVLAARATYDDACDVLARTKQAGPFSYLDEATAIRDRAYRAMIAAEDGPAPA